MCGIIGIVARHDVVKELYLGLFDLQHRGQDACGILTNVGHEMYMVKEQGSVSTVFTPERLSTLRGNVGIGHTRYPTVGSNPKLDSHPFLVNSSVKLGIAQNGNLTNYYELKEKLKKKGVFLSSSTDTEVIVKILAHEYEITQDIFISLKNLYKQITGSYSVVCVLENKGLLAFRDPNGIRPLVMGKKKDAYIFASESVVLQALGYEYVRDVLPGEAVFISNDLVVESHLIQEGKKAHCMFEWVYFSRADSYIDGRSVYNTRLKLGAELARNWKIPVDVVVPVPDTARTAAVKFAEMLGVKCREGLIKNRYIGRTFIMGNQQLREDAVRIKLNPILSVVAGKRVALFDDSIVRGTTSKRIIQLLRDAGAKEVHFISTCPPIIHPCVYGIDMPTKTELIAANKSVEQIRQYIGADTLTYQSIDAVAKSIKKDDLCMACLNGKYPTDVSDEHRAVMERQRAIERGQKKTLIVIGGGGREHALVWKLAQSPHVGKIYAVPGNAGIAALAECVPLPLDDHQKLIQFVREKKVNLTVVGPEPPLVDGIVDSFEKEGLAIFGPNKKAAQLEGSKSFTKNLLQKYNIASAAYRVFTDAAAAKQYLKTVSFPIVVKANGLAAGKGVVIAKNLSEALSAVEASMQHHVFGDAGNTVVIEEFLEGEELSYFLFMDGKTSLPMVSCQDHKRAFDDDLGPNTGGMGAYCPAPITDEAEIKKTIVEPLVNALKSEGIVYKGVLYIGLMKTSHGFKVIEFNCRFGDPECQVIIPALLSDLYEVMDAVVRGRLCDQNVVWSKSAVTTVIIASGGYPQKYETGKKISGLEKFPISENLMLFHAGTLQKEGGVYTNGGRVLCVTGIGTTVGESIERAYEGVKYLRFDGMQFRHDIGRKALVHVNNG